MTINSANGPDHSGGRGDLVAVAEKREDEVARNLLQGRIWRHQTRLGSHLELLDIEHD